MTRRQRKVKESELEKFNELLAELRAQQSPILVEGLRDREALRALDVKGEILIVNVGEGLAAFCEKLALKYDEVVLLVDWDLAGRKLCKILKAQLEANGVKLNLTFWEELRRLCGWKFRAVEDLVWYLRNKASMAEPH